MVAGLYPQGLLLGLSQTNFEKCWCFEWLNNGLKSVSVICTHILIAILWVFPNTTGPSFTEMKDTALDGCQWYNSYSQVAFAYVLMCRRCLQLACLMIRVGKPPNFLGITGNQRVCLLSFEWENSIYSNKFLCII